MMVFFAVAGLVSVLLGDWKGALACAICLAGGLIGLASQRSVRSISHSFYTSVSKTPALLGIYYMLLGLIFILIALGVLLKILHVL